MGSRKADPSFVREVQRALQHLYNRAELSRSPLVELLGADRHRDPTSSLEEILTEAIEWLRPKANVPPQADAWRVYHAVSQRYVEQFPQAEISEGLSVSPRQLRRLQRLGLQAVANHLWTHRSMDQEGQEAVAAPASREPVPPGATGPPPDERELEWLRQSCPTEPVDAAEAIRSALAVVDPLRESLGVRVEGAVPENLPRLAVPLPAFRHALLNILAAAIRAAEGGRVQMEVEARLGQVWMRIAPVATGQVAAAALSASDENLKMAGRLLALAGGSLELLRDGPEPAPMAVRLRLRAAQQVGVLVIDDNVDALQLCKRYLTGTRYRFIGLSDPGRALALAEEAKPQIVVLDLMLPEIDGWELLARLREHPQTRQIPVIVCSILPQEDLALALGAVALIRKPVSQDAFLSALDRELGRLCQESH